MLFLPPLLTLWNLSPASLVDTAQAALEEEDEDDVDRLPASSDVEYDLPIASSDPPPNDDDDDDSTAVVCRSYLP